MSAASSVAAMLAAAAEAERRIEAQAAADEAAATATQVTSVPAKHPTPSTLAPVPVIPKAPSQSVAPPSALEVIQRRDISTHAQTLAQDLAIAIAEAEADAVVPVATPADRAGEPKVHFCAFCGAAAFAASVDIAAVAADSSTEPRWDGAIGLPEVTTGLRRFTKPAGQLQHVIIPSHIAGAAENSADGMAERRVQYHCRECDLPICYMFPTSNKGEQWVWVLAGAVTRDANAANRAAAKVRVQHLRELLRNVQTDASGK